MATKAEIVQELDELGIAFDENDLKKNLSELLENVKDELGIAEAEKVESTVSLKEPKQSKKKETSFDDWVEVTLEQVKTYENEGKLCGYKPITKERGLALIKEET